MVLSVALGASQAFAVVANLTYSSDTNVYISDPGYTLTIKSGSTLTSLVVNTTSIDIVIPISSTFTLASRNNVDLTGVAGATSTTSTCSGTTNTRVFITGADSTGTYTITPNGGVCNSNAGGGGGGGGGGSSYTPPVTVVATPAVPATPATPGTNIAGCGNRTTGFSTSSGVSCVGNTSTTPATPATPATPSSGSGTTFTVASLGTTTLKNGSKGNAVKELQKLLNNLLNLGLVVDGKLGPKTIAVIKTWQKAHGLVADGLVGKLTKAAMVAEAQ